jgi:hypothetical protein
VRQRPLGTTVDASDPASIANGVSRWLADPHTDFDPDAARRFYLANTEAEYARVLFDWMRQPT